MRSFLAILLLAGLLVLVGGCITQQTRQPDLVNQMAGEKLQSVDPHHQLGVSKWEVNPQNNTIIFYVYDVRNESELAQLQGKNINGTTIIFIHDTEFEISRNETYNQLARLRKYPEYKIGQIVMLSNPLTNPPGKFIELWVTESTPENMKLNNQKIDNWTILVYPVSS